MDVWMEKPKKKSCVKVFKDGHKETSGTNVHRRYSVKSTLTVSLWAFMMSFNGPLGLNLKFRNKCRHKHCIWNKMWVWPKVFRLFSNVGYLIISVLKDWRAGHFTVVHRRLRRAGGRGGGGEVRNKTNGLNITIIYIFCYCLTGKIYLVCDFISGLHSAVVRKRFVNHLFTSCFVFCGPETTGLYCRTHVRNPHYRF